jgi:3-methyladenine DNA glycosylase AlkC
MLTPGNITPDAILDEIRGKGILSIRRIVFDIGRQLSPEQSLTLARVLLQYEDVHGPMAAALLAGHISYVIPDAMVFLRETVSLHPHLKVQDCLAKAMDHYCLNLGYEKALPVMQEWAKDAREFVRRAAVEAPRPWTKKEYWKAKPEEALAFVSALKNDPSPYVRFSVGVAVAEISQDFPDMVKAELEKWNTKDAYTGNTYVFASRQLHSHMGKVFTDQTKPAEPKA